MLRVFIISDVPLYEEGLERLLASDGRLTVVGSAGEWADGVDRIRALAAPPAVVLVDLAVPASADRVGELVAEFPETEVIALAFSDDEEGILRWAESGVSGLLSRSASLDDLVLTVETAARGEVACSPRVTAALLRRVARFAQERRGERMLPALTAREREIAGLIVEGLSNKEIAARLQIELPTVKNHVHHILSKLNANRRGQAAAMLRTQPPPERPLPSPART
jgi:two-component system nitrate/nitrite response regulator NarL